MDTKSINLDKVNCEKNRLNYEFSSSLSVFKKKSFFIEYDTDISSTPESIRNIPFAAIMLPIAWATGAELNIPSLDKEYMEHLPKCSEYFKKWFSKSWSFNSSLRTRAVKNYTQPSEYALLFSGGLDSMTAYIRNEDKKPQLFMIFGADIPLSSRDFIETCKKNYLEFATKQKVIVHFINTTILEILNHKELEKYAKSWWGDISHGLILTSLVAPQGYSNIKTLFLASCISSSDYPGGSQPEIIDNIQWAKTNVELVNVGLTRGEKIERYLKEREVLYKYLRVCWKQFNVINCSECEKCLRTICDLLAHNIDPAKCNFKINDQTLSYLQRKLTKRYYTFIRSECLRDFWRNIQESIQTEKLEDLYGSKDFFLWLSTFEPLKRRLNPALLRIYSGLMTSKELLNRTMSSLVKLTPSSHFLGQKI